MTLHAWSNPPRAYTVVPINRIAREGVKIEPMTLVLVPIISRYTNARDSANIMRVPTRAIVKEGVNGVSPVFRPALVSRFPRTFWRLTPQKTANETRITREAIKVETGCDSAPGI